MLYYSFTLSILTLLGVSAHITGLRKGLMTIGMWTNVGFAASMIVEVCLQVMFLGEGFRTNRTIEGLNTRM